MTTLSRPVIYDEAAITAGDIDADDTNVNGSQWSRLLRYAGTGPSSGYVLTLSAVADTATLSTGWGIWNGYTCEITVTHTVSLPAVVSPKTYSIGVLYDPANLSTADGPLEIAVYDKASISLPSGGLFWTLYEIDRLPSTVLTSSTTRNMRVVPSTTIYVPTGVVLPPAAQHSYGTLAVTPTSVYRRLSSPSASWVLVNGDSDWVDVSPAAGAVSAGFGSMETRLVDTGTTRQFRGSVKRSDGGTWAAGVPVRLGGVGTGSAPAFARTWGVVGPTVSVGFELRTNGDIYMTPTGSLGSTRIDGSVPL